jgi:hypothetical protein
MLRLNPKLLAGVALSALLGACSNASNIAAPPPTATPGPSPAPVALQNRFGAAFSALFTGSADVEASEPTAGSVPQVDQAAEGIDG